MKSVSRIASTLLRALPPLLITLGYAAVAQADFPVIQLSDCSVVPAYTTFRAKAGEGPALAFDPRIGASPGGDWSVVSSGTTCTGSGDNWNCAGLAVVLKTDPTATETEDFAPGTGGAGASEILNVQVGSCEVPFTFTAVSSTLGWGDPHLTTVDGVHYDFQSAGEFTALREPGFELQTRQTEVPTASAPITNPYTGITHCVAIYTAVAAKVGSSRVTVQPSSGTAPDPASMVVRVDGKVVTLGDAPYVIHAGGSEKGVIDGTIRKHPDGQFEITDARGTQLVVTSAYWPARQIWYLNVNVYGTSAQQGTMGKLGERSWLPALPDGTSLGGKPDTETERYQVLYEKFADAWRVTDQSSLFDYEAGTNTATFTREEWPRNHPESCTIEGQTPAPAATPEVAEEACKDIVNAVHRADCVVDVMVTGNVGFGKTALVAQRFSPLPPGWYSPTLGSGNGCKDCPACKECKECKECPAHPPWWCWVAIGIAILLLVLLVLRVRRGA